MNAVPKPSPVGLLTSVRASWSDVTLALPALVIATTLRFLFSYTLVLAAFWTQRAHAIASAGAQLIFLFNLFWSLFKGESATENPWEATSLEWSIPSPPPFDNFAGVHPVVNHGPYEYAVPGAAKDYIMQTDPL